MLLDAGEDVDVKNKGGKTPLHVGVEVKNYDAVSKLFNSGVDIEIRDATGFSVTEKADRRVMKILSRRPVQPVGSDSHGGSIYVPEEEPAPPPASIAPERVVTSEQPSINQSMTSAAPLNSEFSIRD